jgi:hypothetical protein
MSQVQVDLLTATQTAIDEVGPDSTAVESALRTEAGYLVYIVSVIDPNYTIHRVLVDPSTGEVLASVERPNVGFAPSPLFTVPPTMGNQTMTGNQTLPAGP